MILALAAPAALPARAQSDALAGIQAQIVRYGCHLPQYATSIEGCRQLHARARALAAGRPDWRAPPSYPPSEQRYSAPYGPAPRYRPAPRPPRGGTGFFSQPFPAHRYDSYRARSYSGWGSREDYNYSPAPSVYGTYRTLCVRLCDGYYFPISYSTVRSRFARDSEACESSCAAPARLFVYPNPGGEVERMVDLEGKPYAELENAFRYRKELVPGCRCRPEPWTDAGKQDFERRVEQGTEGTGAERNAAGKEQSRSADAPEAMTTRRYERPVSPSAAPGHRRIPPSNDPYGRWSAGF